MFASLAVGRIVLPCVVLTSLLGSCAWFPTPENPRLSVTPVGGLLQLEGRAKMESIVGGGKQKNDAVDLGSGLNLGDRDFSMGGVLAYGDEFQGAELRYLYFETKAYDTVGTLYQDFGNLDRGDMVSSEAVLNQYRLNYVARVFEESRLTEPVVLRVGAGLGIHHNDFRMSARSQGDPPDRTQSVGFQDHGIPVLLGRLEAEWAPFRLRLDGGWMEGDWGDVDGRILDLAVTVHYRIQRGLSAWVGLSRYDLPAKGSKDGLDFEFDMSLRGYIAGIRFEF